MPLSSFAEFDDLSFLSSNLFLINFNKAETPDVLVTKMSVTQTRLVVTRYAIERQLSGFDPRP